MYQTHGTARGERENERENHRRAGRYERDFVDLAFMIATHSKQLRFCGTSPRAHSPLLTMRKTLGRGRRGGV